VVGFFFALLISVYTVTTSTSFGLGTAVALLRALRA